MPPGFAPAPPAPAAGACRPPLAAPGRCAYRRALSRTSRGMAAVGPTAVPPRGGGAASAAGGALPGAASAAKIWIPVDVKIHWFSFLSSPDLARASRACKSWGSLVSKTCDAVCAVMLGAPPPSLSRAGKLRFLHRLHHAHTPDNMGYLLSWAAGCRGTWHRDAAPSRTALRRVRNRQEHQPPSAALSPPCRVHAILAQAAATARRHPG